MERLASNESRTDRELLRLALPSDGDLSEPSLAFMQACGVPVERSSARQYKARVLSLEGTAILFQRTADITQKVEEGNADLGIVGLDRFLENRAEDSPVVTLIEDLGFGRCELVLAAPDAWLDVTSVNDVADLAVEFRQQGRQLRIATKYPRLVQGYLFARGIYHFTLVQASGTLEVAPAAGYADLIADLTASGTTLRENRLKTLDDGTILVSQACLIGNRHSLKHNPEGLKLARAILEPMEGYLRATAFYHLSANIRGVSPEEVASLIFAKPDLAGLQGPTIAPVYHAEGEQWYAVSLVVPKDKLLNTTDHLRECGGKDISASQVNYLFKEHSPAYHRLVNSPEGG